MPQPDDYAAGGIIPGDGPATARRHPGEQVISRAQLDKLGDAAVRRLLDRVNRRSTEEDS